MSLEEFLESHPVPPNGRPCSVCAFFRERPQLRNEVLAARRCSKPVSWERLNDYLRSYGATFSWFSLRGHSIHHEGVR